VELNCSGLIYSKFQVFIRSRYRSLETLHFSTFYWYFNCIDFLLKSGLLEIERQGE
jgi:hypothetical protein